MRFSAPNNHNYYEIEALYDEDLKKEFHANKSDVKNQLFSSTYELTTKTSSYEQIDLFQFKPERNRLDNEEQLILKLFSKEDPNKKKQYIVQTGLFSGIVYYNKCQFNITTRYGKQFLNRMLNYVNDIYVDTQSTQAKSSNESNEFQNIIAYLFIHTLERATVLGLPKTYQKQSQHSHKVRGKVDINAYLKENIPFTGKLTTSYRDQVYVNEIIDILYASCLQLEKNYGDIIKRKLLGVHQLLKQHYSGQYPQHTTIQKAKNHSVLNNPMFADYKKVLAYAEIILKEKSLQHDSKSSLTTRGYLFDISQLFEVYLEKLLNRYFDDWEVTGQEELHTYTNMFYGRRMLPDIVMRHRYSKALIVLDAKFKRMRLKKNDLDRSDFHQIHSYIQHYQPHVLFGGLIYPLSSSINTKKTHSNSLFGNPELESGFIVDGIEVNEKISMHEIIENETSFLKRIENLIEKLRV